MQNLPVYVYITFATTVIISVWLFLKAAHYSKPFFVRLIVLIIIQSILGIAGFYNDASKMTAKFPFLILPALLSLFIMFISKKGKAFIDSLDLSTLTVFHTIRIPVEVVLFWLYMHKTIPAAMTFHGRNFDIFSGLSAPFIYYFGFIKKKLNKKVIIAWNLVCLILLLNMVSNAILSLPDRFQQFGFEQPNIAVGYFPFILLPACLVPLVLLSTLAALRQLLKRDKIRV